MIAILGGFGAAILWAAANLASSRSSRLIGASSTVAWMMLVGLAVTTPIAIAGGPVPPITPTLAVWLTASGVGGVVGLLLLYRGLRIGKIGVVLALASTEGAIAAVFSIISGESLSIPVLLTLGLIAAGIATVALAGGSAAEAAEATAAGHAGGASKPGAPEPGAGGSNAAGRHWRGLGDEQRAALFGAGAAIAFGFAIYGTGRAGQSLPIILAVMPARIAGVGLVFVPMALARRLQLSRKAVPLILIVAMGEVVGNICYIIGARESLAIASVLASQFAAVSAIAAYFLFRERLSPRQRYGFVSIAVGLVILTLVRG